MNNHNERAHAKYSPSSLESRELCAGWENAENEEETTWATDGENCHEAIEAKMKGDETRYEALNGDLRAFVDESYDYAYPRIAGSEKIVHEERLYHKHPTLRDVCHGTPDLYAITGNVAQLIDFKFGRRPVTDAKINLQGWAYALALFDTYENLQEITIHFVVPRVYRNTTCATFTRQADYDKMLGRLLRTVERVGHSFSPSWSACAYCGRKSTCEALTEMVQAAYELECDEFTPVNLVEAVNNVPAPEALGFLNNATKVIEDWVKQMQTEIKNKAIEGQEVKGYELRFSKGRTTVSTLDKVLTAGLDIPVEVLLQHATVPLAQLKAIYTEGAEEKGNKEKELMSKLATARALKSGEEICYLYRTNENN